MQKSDLLSQLENAKNNYILVLAACSMFSNNNSFPVLEESSCKFGSYSLDFKDVAALMKKRKDRDIACKEFVNMGLRVLIKETFELIKDYSESNSQEAIFKKKDWYQFARMIRNCLSHNFIFNFNKYDKEILNKKSIKWKKREITLAMDNTPLKLSFFGYTEAWELFDEMQQFVKNDLT